MGRWVFSSFPLNLCLSGGEGEISFQSPPPLLQSRAALGEREALKHCGQADFSGSSLPPPTPAPPPHDWGVGMEGGVGAHPTGRDSRWRDAEEEMGRIKGLRGQPRRAVRSLASPSPGSRRTPSFTRGFPRRAAPSPQQPRHTRYPAARVAAPGRSAPRARRGSQRLRRPGRGAAAGPRRLP